MEVQLDSDVQAKLSRIAVARGSDAELLAREATESFVDYDEWFIREVPRPRRANLVAKMMEKAHEHGSRDRTRNTGPYAA